MKILKAMAKPARLWMALAFVWSVFSASLFAEDYDDDQNTLDEFHEKQVRTFGPGYVRQSAYNAKADYGMGNRVKFLNDISKLNPPATKKSPREDITGEISDYRARSSVVAEKKRSPTYADAEERSSKLPVAITDYLNKIQAGGERSIESYKVMLSGDKYTVFMAVSEPKTDGVRSESVSMQVFDMKGQLLGGESDILGAGRPGLARIEGLELIPEGDIAVLRTETASPDEIPENGALILSLYDIDGEQILNNMILDNFMMRFDGLRSNIDMLTEPGRIIVYWMDVDTGGGDYVIKEINLNQSDQEKEEKGSE